MFKVLSQIQGDANLIVELSSLCLNVLDLVNFVLYLIFVWDKVREAIYCVITISSEQLCNLKFFSQEMLQLFNRMVKQAHCKADDIKLDCIVYVDVKGSQG